MPFALLALIPLKDWLYVGAIIALLAAGGYTYHRVREAGWDAALKSVERQNDSAVSGARKAQTTADECYAREGAWSWSVVTGECLQ